MDTLASELESNVQNILEKLMTNLANLGYENGFELESHITTPTPTEPPIKDCDYLASKDYESGVHALMYNGKQIEGFCEIRKDDYNWLVIQKRVEDTVSFYRAWDAYKEGFGDLMGSFYFGNEKIHEITSSREHVLRVELSDSSGDTGFAEYSNFSVSSEDDGYRLHYNKFIGGSAGNSLAKSKGQRFSTFDNDGDESQFYSCSRLHKGAFWYSKCGNANLNGVYIKYETSTFNWENVFWYSWKKDLRSLHSVQMLIRPSP